MKTPHEDSSVDPRERLLDVLSAGMLSRALLTAATLKIADHVKDLPTPVEDIASASGTEPSALYRLLRALSGSGIFAESPGRAFQHNAVSQRLVSDRNDSLCHLLMTHDLDAHYAAWGNLKGAVRTGKCAFEEIHQKNCFEYLSGHPKEAAIFFRGLGDYTRYRANTIAEAYDFSKASVIVELGGGQGDLLAAILMRAPKARGILLDLASAEKNALENFRRYEIADRASFAAGDFSRSVPEGADIYLSKYCLHDWDDAACTKILRIIREKMKPDSRVLIIEMLIPELNTPSLGRLWDLEALVVTTGGRERTREEFSQIFEQAGLRLNRVIPADAHTHLLEASR